MKLNRAKEIASSPIMANVTYDGVPIYIEHVNERNDIAYIHSLDNPKDRQQVSITNLKER